MFPAMKWYEQIINARVDIPFLCFRFGSGMKYRQKLRELVYKEWTDIESSEDEDDLN